ncbi:calcium uptake protein 3, mitochondrial isoform X2 [Ischnura elegans]|uniref:calcium uptake protein 3, mitochondrial isoform X2 n=1 Tax=Ischnura elegans TaxID=197161 RepID=UPI001ED8B605|nr:calcium uptake protein 3, mitochondrial isoform X2 [Ischnura elegans]
MAVVGRLLARKTKDVLLPGLSNCRSQSTYRNFGKLKYNAVICTCIFGGSAVLWYGYRWNRNSTVYALKLKKDEASRPVKLTSRERRFIKFASVEFDNQVYMTPQDFLESVVEAEPRARLKRRKLTAKELESMKNSTPSLKEGSTEMFRNLRDRGIISYTEYLFLLSILTKPQTGFRIAFNMFDTDGNERVDKNEFLVMEKIFSHAWRDKRGLPKAKTEDEAQKEAEEKENNEEPVEEYVDDDQGLQRRHQVDTTLLVHFFGKKGKEELRFEGFRRFMENLQTEVLELEFHEFSKGQDTITEVDFARILLRYTYLDMDEYDRYLERLLDRIREERGISFEEFRVFCQFLNNLDDFSIAMRMYTLADNPISQEEFERAVRICTGKNLSKHLVRTVFQIFDEDGDGRLSHREFIAIMKDRLHRGFKSYAKNEGWEAFKSCVKQEMKSFV